QVTGVDQLDWHRQEAERLEAAGQWPAAAWHLERLIDLQPLDASLRFRLGQVHAADPAGLDRVIAAYAEAIRLDLDYWQPYFYRGLAYYRTRQYEKMVPDFT